MSLFVVFDTNVLVSAMLSHNITSSTVKIVNALYGGWFVPLYNDEILSEYREVLHREKFSFSKAEIENILEAVVKTGVQVPRTHCDEHFPDPKDVMFFETALSVDGAFVVTGNLKHFPKSPIVVTPAELMGMC